MNRFTYSLREVTPYINWIYFFHAWGVKPASIHSPEAEELRTDALGMLDELEGHLSVKSLCRLCQAYAEGDNLILDGIIFPLLRQQIPQAYGEPHLCLSDFVRPLALGKPDTVGVFATSVSGNFECGDDPYRKLLTQTLADRLAEAATEKMHEHVRRIIWGYAPDEHLNIPSLLAEKFQGIRPAVGYPSLPDQSVNFLIDRLLDMKQIGITLTENGAMNPSASVSGLMLAHPAARYFSIGPIGRDQLEDYARRRDIPIERMKKFLASNLKSCDFADTENDKLQETKLWTEQSKPSSA